MNVSVSLVDDYTQLADSRGVESGTVFHYPNAVIEDQSYNLLLFAINFKRNLAHKESLNLFESRNMFQISERLEVIDDIFNMFEDFSDEDLLAFQESIQRRPFFE